jgi:hypothetical protein
MNPDTIQLLLLARAAEEADSRGEQIPFSEREEATRQALAVTGDLGKSTAGKNISDSQWRFLAERAGFLRHRAQGMAGDVSVPLESGRVGAGLCLAAFVFGFASHAAGLSRSFDLLALPLLLLLLWNAAIYAFWIYGLIRKSGTEGGDHGLIARLVVRKTCSLGGAQTENRARKEYVKSMATWLRSWGTPTIASWFHAGSACFVLGLLAAIYIRGIHKEYVAGWESTWLSARGVSAVVGGLLAPASWFSGIPLPDSLDGWSRLKRVPGSAGENAGPWIHLYAITLIGWIVLPRLVLSFAAGFRARRLRATPPKWEADEPYLRRILGLARQDGDFSIAILPFDIKNPGMIRDGAYRDAFERLVRETWGLGARPCWLECAVYGDEDGIWDGPWADAEKCEGAVLLFDIHATAEDEVHGALFDAVLKRFTGGNRGVLAVLETARFTPERVPSRLALWRELAWKRKVAIFPVDAAVARDTALSPSSLVHPSN